MEIGEIRVGSWYLSTKFGVPVKCTLADLWELHIKCDGTEVDSEVIATVFQPLLITEEWILKSGQKPHNLDGGCWGYGDCVGYYPKSDGWHFIVDANDDGYGGFNYSTTEIEYVHQLQALYFYWNKEELEIKKPD